MLLMACTKGVHMLVFCLLVIPWIQFFVLIRKNRYQPMTLSCRNGFFHVFFTVFNVALIIGTLCLLIKGGDEQDMQFGYDRLMNVLEMAMLLYVPWSLGIIFINIIGYKTLQRNDSDVREYKIMNWILSSAVFVLLGIYVFDGWWNWRYDFYQGRACHCVNGKWGYIDRFHRVIVEHIYDNCGYYDKGVAIVGMDTENGTRYGCVDREGTLIIPCVNDWCSPLLYGVIHVKRDGKCGCFTAKGVECVPLVYDSMGCFFPDNEGLAMVRSGDRHGFIRRNGDVAIAIAYDSCETFFSHGLVRAKLFDKWGYLDHTGNEAIPFNYDEAGNFIDGRAEVQVGSEKYYIDTNGCKIFEN